MKAAGRIALAFAAVVAATACRSAFEGDSSLDPPGRLSAMIRTSGQVELFWDGAPPAVDYVIEWTAPGGATTSLPIPPTDAYYHEVDLSGQPGIHTFAVRSRRGTRTGPPSALVQVEVINAPLAVLPMWSASGGSPGQGFGLAVAAGDFDGDGLRDLAVGAPSATVGGAPNAGAVSIFRGTRTGLATTALLSLSDSSPNDLFGSALGVADIDGDGYDDLLVGIPGRTSGAGRVEIFKGSPIGPTSPASSFLDGPVGAGHFGASLSFLPGADADAVIGAPGGPASRGRVRRYAASSGALLPSPLWTTSSATPGDAFGSAIAVVPGAHLVVGAPYHVPTAALGSAGRIEVLSLVDGSVVWATDGAVANAHLGFSVAAGDLDGDGRADVVAGAPDRGTTGEISGWCANTNGTWSAGSSMDGDEPGERLGYSVAIAPGLHRGDTGVLAGAPLRSSPGASMFTGNYCILLRDFEWEPQFPSSGEVVRAVGDFDGDPIDDIAIFDPAGGRGRVALYASRSNFGPQANAGLPQIVYGTTDVRPIGASFGVVHPSRGGYRCTWTWDDDPQPQEVDDCNPQDPAGGGLVHHVFQGPGDHWVKLHVFEPHTGVASESVTRIRVR